MSPRQAYRGVKRKLIVAFDVGTTYSGASYSLLDPGEVPSIVSLTRYPAQENSGGAAKIPTIIYYDRQGRVKAVGAEALKETIVEEHDWFKAEWFKLHLRPRSMRSQIAESDVPPLPPNKSVSELYKSVERDAEFLLTHPNGWEGSQQALMRQSAVLAGLISDAFEDQGRLQFVTEGEASLHFCVNSGESGSEMKSGQGAIIVDAGGGTLDLSAYFMKALYPSTFVEIAPAECRMQGSIFIKRRAHEYLTRKLEGSKYDSPEDINVIVDTFDKTTKLKFRDPSEPAFIRFGSLKDNDRDYNIRNGQLKLPGEEVAALFDPSVEAVIEAIEAQSKIAEKPIEMVFLVGGFAGSDYLYAKLNGVLKVMGIKFCRPDQNVNKAVSEGVPSNPEHRLQSPYVITLASGDKVIPKVFSVILPKGTRVSEEQEFRRAYFREGDGAGGLEIICQSIICYRSGSVAKRVVMSTEPELFPVCCRIEANAEAMARNLAPIVGANGKRYFRQRYSIVLLFGLTELKAQIAWEENGVEKRSPAAVVFED